MSKEVVDEHLRPPRAEPFPYRFNRPRPEPNAELLEDAWLAAAQDESKPIMVRAGLVFLAPGKRG